MTISFGGLGLPPLYTELKVKIDSFKTDMEKAGHIAVAEANNISKQMAATAAVGTVLRDIGKKATMYVTVPLAAAGVASGKFAMDYESAFAGVRKTVDATEEEYAKLSQGIRDMAKEVPTGAAAIASVTEAAGQLGIEKKNLLDFTKVMIDLGEATNLTATEGATQLARFANITGMSQNDFSRLGSTIVDLGNNFATTEAEIVAMGMRLAGSGKQIGLSEAQMMGFATALSSVGIEAEAGGSAFSKVMVDMQLAVETNSERLQDFAGVAGMSADQFKKAFQEDAASAMIAFIKGLGTAEERGLSAIKVLDDMGISEVRMRDALLRAGGASDVFTKAIQVGNKAWEENTALTKEAEQRYGTSESQMKILKNRLMDVAIELGEKLLPPAIQVLEKVTELVEWFGNLGGGTQDLIVKLGLAAAAFGPVTNVAGGLLGVVSKMPSAFKLFQGGTQMALGGMKLFGTGAGTLTGVLGKITAAAGAGGASGALSGTGAALATAAGAAAPFLLAGGAVAAVGYGIYKGFQTKAVPAVDHFADQTTYATEAVGVAAGNMAAGFERVTKTVSDETKAQVQAFLDLKQATEQTTMEMYAGITEVTDTNVQQIKSNVQEMAQSGITAVEEQRNRNIADFKELYLTGTQLSADEKQEIVQNIVTMAEERKKTIEDASTRIAELYEIIRQKGVGEATAEKEEIETLMNQLADVSIAAMARNQDEQEVILNNLRRNKGNVTQKMVSETIAKLNEQRDKGVAAAQEQYQKQINFALDYKESLRSTHGELSADQEAMVNKMIEAAERQKEETVSAYDQVRENGLVKLRDEYGNLATDLDTKTGQIRGFLDRLINGAKEWNAFKFEDKVINTTYNNRTVNTTEEIRVSNTRYHYNGLDHVPYDGYNARLHKGERVLTAKENEVYSSGMTRGINVNIENFTNNTKEDVQALVRRIGNELKRQKVGVGAQ